MAKVKTCNGTELAEYAGCTPSYISQLLSKNVLEKSGDGKFDVIKSLSAMLLHRGDENLKERETLARIGELEERKEFAKTKRMEMQGELMVRAEVYEMFTQFVTGIAKIHDEFERNIKRKNPNIDDATMGEILKASNWVRHKGKELLRKLAGESQ